MVLDTSVLVTILLGEPEGTAFQERIDEAEVCLLSAASFVESSIVMGHLKGQAGRDQLDLFIVAAGIEIVPVDRDQALLARSAYKRFGKGNDPAGLNFGDCFSYALSKAVDEPLFFKGDDFSRTDVQIA